MDSGRMTERQISICLTHYNRPSMIVKAFEKVIDDPRIASVCISDDHSEEPEFQDMMHAVSKFPKVSVRRNYTNLGVGGNKAKAIEMSPTKWCIIFDSDNEMDVDYIDTLFSIPIWDEGTIYAPSFAKPFFDYRKIQGKLISSENVRGYIGKNGFECFLNTGNYFVNRDRFISMYDHKQVKGADSIYIVYLWLKAGNSILAVPHLHYDHLVHNGSYYKSVAGESEPLCKHYEQLIKEL